MPGKITKNFRLYNTRQFIENFSGDSPASVYFFIGNSLPWEVETNPPEVVDANVPLDVFSWRNMLSAKRIAPSDVSFGVPRNEWRSGEVYSDYSSTEETTSRPFFVITEDFDIYKCLDNNNESPSTVRPTGRLTTSFQTSDGYVWKYMMSVSASSALKFAGSSYIPVKYLLEDDGSQQWRVQQEAVGGSIDAVDIVNGGNSYLETTGGVVSSPSSTTVVLAANASGNDDFYNGMSIYVISGNGSGQSRRIVDYSGGSRTITVDSPFSPQLDASSTYVVSPTVRFTGEGTGARAFSRVTGGEISDIVVVSPGSGYVMPTVEVVSPQGAGASLSANAAPLSGHGSDAVSELFAHNVILSIKLDGGEDGKFMVGNEFRTVGILVDPRVANGSTTATGVAYDQTLRITLTDMSMTFTKDEVVRTESGFRANVVEYVDDNILRVTRHSGELSQDQTLTGDVSGASGRVFQVQEPELSPFSGEILYAENRTPTTRTNTQIEDIKLFVRF